MGALTDIQDNIEKLRSLQESLHDLCAFISTLDLTSGAKEDTLIHGITELKEAFANIDLSSVEQAITDVKNAVTNIDFSTLAKEATLLARVAELKEALNTIDFTAIEKAVQSVEDVTAKEATLIQGVGDIIKAVENIDFTDLENSIAEIKDAVANIDFSTLAKEETLTQGISSVESKVEEESLAIQGKIDNIKLPEVDTTELAKESTLKGLKSSIDNIDIVISDSVAGELAAGKKGIVDAINYMGGDASTIDTLSVLAERIKGLVSNIDPTTIFVDAVKKPIDIFSAIINGDIVEAISYIESIPKYSCSGLSGEKITFLNAISISSYGFAFSALKELHFPRVTSLSSNIFADSEVTHLYFDDLTHINQPNFAIRTYYLKYMYAPKLVSISAANAFYNSYVNTLEFPMLQTLSGSLTLSGERLIDLITGGNIKGNISFSAVGYDPTTAYSKTSASLVNEGENFSTNNEKWNHNLREHFAANLQDRTGLTAFTITFGSTVLAQMEEATIEAFTSKNWTLA